MGDLKTTCKVFIVLLAASLLLVLLSQTSADLAPALAPPVHPVDSKGANLLYICNTSGPNYANDWSNALAESYSITIVDYSQVDYSQGLLGDCGVIIIDPSLDVSEGLASKINSAGKPVLALGLGGAKYLNYIGWTVVAYEFSGSGGFPWFSCPEIARLHEVLEGVNVDLACFPFPEGENVTLIEGGGAVLTVPSLGNYSFLSVNGSVAHFALNNATVLDEYKQDQGVGETFKLLMNMVGWLARGAPKFRLIVAPAVSSFSVSVAVYTYDNSKVGWCGEPGNVELKVFNEATDELVYSGSMLGCNVTFLIGVLPGGSYRAEAERGGCTGAASFQVRSQDTFQPPPLFFIVPLFGGQDVQVALSSHVGWLRGAGAFSAVVGLSVFFLFRRFRL
ncbi:MAG: hypothetical protein KIH01_09190 [Candidatus Freyarchaeota archaeon]|nr:hypothetical protein [Candidatus Jordarchaeia archaeon]